MLTLKAYLPSSLLGILEIPHLGVGFVLEMLSALIQSEHGYSAMPLA